MEKTVSQSGSESLNASVRLASCQKGEKCVGVSGDIHSAGVFEDAAIPPYFLQYRGHKCTIPSNTSR